MANVIDIRQAVRQLTDVFQDEQRSGRHPSDAFFFFVGAGVSFPEVPLAAQIEEDCRRRYGDAPPDAPGPEAPGMERYSYWLRTAFPQPVGRQRYFRELIESKPISAANLRLAHLLLSDKVPRLVVTPNFDDFVSRALTLFGKPHVICDHPVLAERIDPERSEDIQILHVHGSYWFYDLRNLPGELRERAEADTVHRTIASRLDMILANRSPIVIGYSGWKGDVFMTALERRLRAYTLRYNLYWFVYREEEVAALPDFLKDRDDVVLVVPGGETRRGGDGSRPSPTQVDEGPGIGDSQTVPTATKERTLRGARAIFDELIRALDVEAPPLTRNPLVFYADQLRSSLIALSSESGSPAEEFYGISALIERLEAMARDWTAEPAADDQVEEPLEAVRDALRRSLYREAIAHAAGVDLGRLGESQLYEIAEAAWSAATGLLDDSDDELRGYDIVVAATDALGRAGREVTDRLTTRAAEALRNKAITLSTRGETDKANAVFDQVLERFGDAANPDLRATVAKALGNKGYRLGQVGRSDEELAAYEEIIRRFGDDDSPQIREPVAIALFNKGYRLGALGHGERELAAYEEIVRRFGDDDSPALRLQLAMALFNTGYRLDELGRHDEALAAYTNIVDCFAAEDDSALRAHVASALFNRGELLSDLNRSEDAIASYDELVERFGGDASPTLRTHVARALANKVHELGVVQRGTEAAQLSDDVVRKYGDEADAAIRGPVAVAAANKTEALLKSGLAEQAVSASQDTLARYAPDDPVALVRQAYAETVLNRAKAFETLEQAEEARLAYEDVVQRFKDDPDSAVAGVAAKAQAALDAAN